MSERNNPSEAETGRAKIYKPEKGAGGYALSGRGGAVKAGTESADHPPPGSGDFPASHYRRVKAPSAPSDDLMPSPQSHAKMLAETVVYSFTSRLMAEAKKKGGTLTTRDLERLNKEYEKKTESLRAIFERSFEAYVAAREHAAREEVRQSSYDRLMLKDGARLFVGADKKSFEEGGLSKRMLPGFHMALNMMLGPDLIEENQIRCAKIEKRIRATKKDAFRWDDFFNDPEARDVALDALVAIAPYFRDPEKRIQWFVNLVNGHLGGAYAAEDKEAREWELTETAAADFLKVLFGDLRSALSDKAWRKDLSRRHGAQTVDSVTEIMGRLQKEDAGAPH